MFDFKDKTDKLKALEGELDLIDAWADVKCLRTERNRISFLKSYKYIAKTTTRNKIINHVINGEVRFNATTGIRKVGGYHLELGANGKILDTIYTDALGHKICTVAIKDGSGNYFTKLDDMGSPVLNDMFRDDWGLDDILENTALAYDNKIYDTGNLYIGVMSDGKKLGMYIGSPTTPITEYASYFISCFPFGF